MRISDWSSDVCSSDLWRGRGEITLESKDFAAASALASKLADKTAIAQISFLLSREAREAEERKMLSQAAQADRKSAVQGKSVSVRVDLGGRRIIKKKQITTT